VSTITYVGHGVEIEDDVVRMRRRKLESADDLARSVHRSKPRRRRKAVALPARCWRSLPAGGDGAV
jgi:hypothetical protein